MRLAREKREAEYKGCRINLSPASGFMLHIRPTLLR
jgi:hypothetical protein